MGSIARNFPGCPCALTMKCYTLFKLTPHSHLTTCAKVRAFAVGVRQPEGSGGAAHVAAGVAPTADPPGSGDGRVWGIWL